MDIYLSIKTNAKFNGSIIQGEMNNYLDNMTPLFSINDNGNIVPKDNIFFIERGKMADGSSIYITNTDKLESKNLCFFSGELEKHIIQFFELLLYAIKKHPDAVKNINSNTPFPFIVVYFGTLERSTKIVVNLRGLTIRKSSASLVPKRTSKSSLVMEIRR